MRNGVTALIGKAGLVCLSILALFSQFAVAQEVWQEEPRMWAVGFKAGFGLPLADADLDNKFDKASAKLTLEDFLVRDTFTVGAMLRYSFLDWLSAGVNLDFSTSRVANMEVTVANAKDSTDNGTYQENLGRTNTVTFMAVVEFKLPPQFSYRRFSPYFMIGGGVNMHFWQDPSGGLSTEVDPGFGLLVGGGVEFFMNPNVTLQLEMAWYYDVASFTSEYKSGSQTITRYSGDLDLSHLDFLLGMRFYF